MDYRIIFLGLMLMVLTVNSQNAPVDCKTLRGLVDKAITELKECDGKDTDPACSMRKMWLETNKRTLETVCNSQDGLIRNGGILAIILPLLCVLLFKN